MSQFADAANRKWSIEIDYEAIRRVKEATQINLLEALPRSGEDEDNPLIVKLDFDAVLMLDVVHAVIQPQLDAAGVKTEDFVKSFTIQNHQVMANAFWEAYIDFFQSLGWEHVVKAITNQRSVSKGLIQKTAESIDKAAGLTLKAADGKLQSMLDEIAVQ